MVTFIQIMKTFGFHCLNRDICKKCYSTVIYLDFKINLKILAIFQCMSCQLISTWVIK